MVTPLAQRLDLISIQFRSENASVLARQVVRTVASDLGLELFSDGAIAMLTRRPNDILTSMHNVMHMKSAEGDGEGMLLHWEREVSQL